MPEACYQIEEWIEEIVEKPVTTWVESTEEVCEEAECGFLCLNKIFCAVLTVLVRVVTFVVSVVLKLVTRIVCEVVSLVLETLVSIVRGVVKLIVAIFTLNWRDALWALFDIGGAIVKLAHGLLIRVKYGGVAAAWIVESVADFRLRNHVRQGLEGRFRGESLEAIKEALGVDHGYFGFRVKGRAVRLFVDSDFKADDLSEIPDLLALHLQGDIDLFELAGFDYPFFNQSRFYAVLKQDGPFVTGGSILLNDGIPQLSREQLQTYIDSDGAEGPSFQIFSMSQKLMESKMYVAREKMRKLGIVVDWEYENVRVSELIHIIQANAGQRSFFTTVLDRRQRSVEREPFDDALDTLCTPLIVGIFRYENLGTNGLGSSLISHPCNEDAIDETNSGNNIFGGTFKDRLPDTVFKYVAAHELGHSYSLCHVKSGIERIMFTIAESGIISWKTILDFGYLHGEPTFTMSEAFQVWDYLIANATEECLMERQHS